MAVPHHSFHTINTALASCWTRNQHAFLSTAPQTMATAHSSPQSVTGLLKNHHYGLLCLILDHHSAHQLGPNGLEIRNSLVCVIATASSHKAFECNIKHANSQPGYGHHLCIFYSYRKKQRDTSGLVMSKTACLFFSWAHAWTRLGQVLLQRSRL